MMTTPDERGNRYLTEPEKLEILAAFEETRAVPVPLTVRGGEGFPDPVILPWCDLFNTMRGVCTLQSCAGHRYETSAGIQIYPGHLWLRFNERVSAQVYARIEKLLVHEEIRQVSLLYATEDAHEVREITSVLFRGDEVSAEAFGRAMVLLATFLGECADEAVAT